MGWAASLLPQGSGPEHINDAKNACQHGIDQPPLLDKHIWRARLVSVLWIFTLVINKNCANKKQKQIRRLYFLRGLLLFSSRLIGFSLLLLFIILSYIFLALEVSLIGEIGDVRKRV